MLRDALVSAIRSRRHVVVDLASVTYIDMKGFRVFEASNQAVGGQQGLALTAASPLVHKVIEIIEFGKTFPVFPSLQAALDFVRSRYRNDEDNR